jgi:hypothetical protein
MDWLNLYIIGLCQYENTSCNTKFRLSILSLINIKLILKCKLRMDWLVGSCMHMLF